MKTIGIIGGAGPMASAVLVKKIIARCQKRYQCVNDYDFPKLMMVSYPFAEMLKPDSEDQEESMVAMQLKETVDFFLQNGTDFYGIACNTLHGFLGESFYGDAFVHLIDETNAYLEKLHITTVMVLCTSTSSQKKVHSFAGTVRPDNAGQAFIDALIQKVLRGSFTAQDSEQLKAFIFREKINNPSIDALLLGCTELSVLLDTYPIDFPMIKVIDPVEVLANKLCGLVYLDFARF